MKAAKAQKVEVGLQAEAGETPQIAPEAVNAKGQDVLGAVQSLHEVLKARAEALEAFRDVLNEQKAEIEVQRAELTDQQNTFCDDFEKRDAELIEREKACGDIDYAAKTAKAKHEGELKKAEGVRAELGQAQDALSARDHALDERERALDDVQLEVGNERDALEQQVAKLTDERKSWESDKSNGAAALRELEAERTKLEADREKLRTAFNQLNEKTTSIEARESDIAAQASALEAQVAALQTEAQALASDRGALENQRTEWQSQVDQVSVVGQNLADLQEDLDRAVGTIAEEQTELLKRFQGNFADTPAAENGASESEKKARAAVSRFEKLCRDAKRRPANLQ